MGRPAPAPTDVLLEPDVGGFGWRGLLLLLLVERRKRLKDLLPACAVASGRAALPAGLISTHVELSPEVRRVRAGWLSWCSYFTPPAVTTGGVAEVAACNSRRPLLRPEKVAPLRRCARLVADVFFFTVEDPGSEGDGDDDDEDEDDAAWMCPSVSGEN